MNNHTTPTKVVFDDKNKETLFFDSLSSTTKYLGINNYTIYRKFKETSENFIRIETLKVSVYTIDSN